MAVYVDNAGVEVNGIGCFHMTADDDVELEEMAERLDLDPNWREVGSTGRSFYLVNRQRRPEALTYGAKPISRVKMARLSR